MRSGYKILLGLFLCFMVVSIWARPKELYTGDQKDNQDTAKAKKKKAFVFLGNSGLSGGPISKRVFDSLLKQGITAKDSSGFICKVDGFMFTYAELKLYEDEVGKLIWLTDYQGEYCDGDTVSKNIASSIYDRTKVGDTLYFDDITVINPKGGSYAGKPMRFMITSAK